MSKKRLKIGWSRLEILLIDAKLLVLNLERLSIKLQVKALDVICAMVQKQKEKIKQFQ